MADYTSEEIEGAVNRIVRTTIRRPYGDLGNRDIGTAFSDIQDAAAGVFISSYSSPFYVVYLGTLRLLEKLVEEVTTVASLYEAIVNTDRLIEDVDNITSLGNAKVALQGLAAATASRNTAFTSIEDVPAFKRYDDNLQKFLDTHSAKIRKNEEIVPTPEEARASLAGIVRTLEEQHEELKERAFYLSDAIGDFDDLNLSSLLSANIINNSRRVLTERVDQLEALSPNARLSVLKDTTLDLLTGRAAIRSLSTLSATTVFVQIEGELSPFADADHPAVPATLSSDIVGPYPIYVGHNTLTAQVDGLSSFPLTIPGSFLAFIRFPIPEPYVETDPVTEGYEITSETDTLLVDIEDFTRLTVTFDPVYYPAWEVIWEINAAITAATAFPAIAEMSFFTFRYRGPVEFANADGTSVDIVIELNEWELFGVVADDFVYVLDPSAGNYGNLYQVQTVDESVLHCERVQGSESAVVEENVSVTIGLQPGINLRFNYEDADIRSALVNRRSITFPDDDTNTALPVFGLTPGMNARSRSTSADLIQEGLNVSASSSLSGVPQLEVESVLEATVHSGLGRSEPGDPTKLVAYTYRGRGDTVGGPTGEVVFDVSGAEDAGVAVDDILVIRETVVEDDVNVYGLVTAVTNTSITADMPSDITAEDNLLVEVGPNLVKTSEYLDLRVSDSLVNNGDYTLAYDGHNDIPFEFTVEQGLPVPTGLGGQPYLFSLDVGWKRVDFSSLTTLLTTAVVIDETPLVDGQSIDAAAEFFDSVPATAVGITPYWLVPEDPKRVEDGDILELYETVNNTPDSTYDVVGVERDNRLIQTKPGISTTYGTIELSQDKELPYARIRKLKKDNYTVFSESLLVWLGLEPNLDRWFPELNRLLNPLISNKNPRLADVNAAKLHVQELQAILTEELAEGLGATPEDTLEAILGAYETRPVPVVDILINTFDERGANRGVDILLQGRFSDFFGLDQATMSYAGNMQRALQAVQVDDLPVRKLNRQGDPSEEMIDGTFEEPDFEFDLSDTDDNEEDRIDIPGSFEQLPPSSR